MPSLFKYLAFAMDRSCLNVQTLRLLKPFFTNQTSQLLALFWRFLRATVIVPTGAKTTTRAAASRTRENVFRLRPTITYSVSAARRARSGTHHKTFATTQPME